MDGKSPTRVAQAKAKTLASLAGHMNSDIAALFQHTAALEGLALCVSHIRFRHKVVRRS